MPAEETPAEATESRIGTVLGGKWTLERLLGVGGMAAAYVARHRIGKREAIKILHPELARQPAFRARFEREARAANAFEHPAIVPIRDVGTTDDGLPFLVMDLLSGETLGERAARGTIPCEELCPLVEELLDALAAAHARGVIHRDIKPDNLLVQPDGRLRVLDFGIARVTSQGPGDLVERTRSGVVIGTACYMPPEQIRGGELDGRADLFAVGATMFRLLSGRHIHARPASEGDLLVRMATERAPPLASVAPHVPVAVAQVVDRALELDARHRYPDAATMRADLKAARSGEALWAALHPKSTAISVPKSISVPSPDTGVTGDGDTMEHPATPAWGDEEPEISSVRDRRAITRPEDPASRPTPSPLAVPAQLRTASVAAKRWALVARVIYLAIAAVVGFLTAVNFEILIVRTASGKPIFMSWTFALVSLAVFLLFLWRGLAAIGRARLPTEQAVLAVIVHARKTGGSVSAAEVAADSAVSVDQAAEALDALTRAGTCKPVTRDGILSYELGWRPDERDRR